MKVKVSDLLTACDDSVSTLLKILPNEVELTADLIQKLGSDIDLLAVGNELFGEAFSDVVNSSYEAYYSKLDALRTDENAVLAPYCEELRKKHAAAENWFHVTTRGIKAPFKEQRDAINAAFSADLQEALTRFAENK